MERKKSLAKVLILTLLFGFISCEKENLSEFENSKISSLEGSVVTARITGTPILFFKGPEVYFGNGKARSWMSVSEGVPQEIGIELTKEALKSLDGSDIEVHKILPLHLKAKELTPFNHVGLDWNPHGHLPEGVFDVPHFDIHFYTISLAEQLAIPEYSPSTDALFNNYPPIGYMPADYAALPGPIGAEPRMGKHWLPMPLPNYLPFTKIMILGTYNGKTAFIEPMITMETIKNLTNRVSTLYSQPQLFEKHSNYPSEYNIYYNEKGNICVSLGHFIAR